MPGLKAAVLIAGMPACRCSSRGVNMFLAFFAGDNCTLQRFLQPGDHIRYQPPVASLGWSSRFGHALGLQP